MPKAVSSTPKAAAIYCRISRDQAGQALGVNRQEDLCRKLADDKRWPVAKVYVDNDISAYSGKRRPQYEAMCAALEAGAIDAVIVVDQDRLTRNLVELERFIVLADRLAVPLANVSGDLDLGSSDGRFRARIMGAVARQESEKKSERLKRQRDQHAQLGRAHGGIRRYGYRPLRSEGNASLEIVESEAVVVREVATRVLAGESLRRIGYDLNRRQISTVSGTAQWRVTTIRTMITGPHLAGLRVHRGEIVGDADWPAILDRATWEQVRAILGDPRRHQAGRPPAHLLSGLLTCGLCGHRLHASKRADSGARRYQCHPGPGSGCGKLATTAESLEAHVSEMVLLALDSPALDRYMATPGPDIEALTRRLQADEKMIDELAGDMAENRISRKEWLTARDIIERRINEARTQLGSASVPDLIDFAGGKLRDMWVGLDTDRRREILSLVIEKITINPGLPGRRRFDPQRVEISWRV